MTPTVNAIITPSIIIFTTADIQIVEDDFHAALVVLHPVDEVGNGGVILQDGQVLDTIVYALASPLETVGPELASVGMYMIQSLINFFIPSGSGQAYVTMPLMTPIADLLSISRQIAVLAYQFGDGFTNMITPTSPVLIGVLGVAKIPYEKWLKWVLPFMAILIFLGWLLLIPTVTMDLNGF